MSCELLSAASARVAVVEVPHRDRDGDTDLLRLLFTLFGTRAGARARLLLLRRVLVLRRIAFIFILRS